MKKNSQEYRQWKRHQDEKKLKLRSKKKRCSKKYSSKTNYKRYNGNNENVPTKFVVPEVFSFINNTEKTIAFFNNVIDYILTKKIWKKNIFIDSSNVKELTSDALIYLLAIINNLKRNEKLNSNVRISGNIPKYEVAKKMFIESGFNRFVKVNVNLPLIQNKDKLKIVTGTKNEPDVAKRISDFLQEKANISLIQSRFIYIMMVELMSNSSKHAYNNSDIFDPCWYCFAKYNNGILSFTFMDIGEGIPSTVRKNFFESTAEKIKFINQEENKYIISALNGDFRTSTGLINRGKGLPKIREICTTGLIQNMRIISHKADVMVQEQDYYATDLDGPLRGTLFYWEIDIERLKEVLV